MTDSELVFNYRVVSEKLEQAGYKVSAISTGFFIHNNKGTVVADVKSVDGLQGFLQGVEWVEATVAGALA